MSAQALMQERQQDWERLESLLGAKAPTAAEVVELASLYRSVAADAARVRGAGADDNTVAYLDGLLSRAHNRLYRAPAPSRGAFSEFVLRGFPQQLRANASFFLWSSLAFYAPFFFGLLCAVFLPGFGHGVMGPEQVESYRRMYESMPEETKGFGTGSMSVSFYIQHNTSIAFRTFATGIFFGLGSLFTLVYNGLVIGTVFGVLIADDKARQILTFTSGHASWELTAIVIAGAAGLRMGWALVSTGGRTRLGSLKAAGPVVASLVGGAAIMLFIAACIEGLWSGSTIPAPVKWGFGALQWVLVGTYLWMGGRDKAVKA